MSYSGRAGDSASQPEEVEPRPTHCASCGSSDVTTASKVINAESYWRCGACGEVWNVGRQRKNAAQADRWYRR